MNVCVYFGLTISGNYCGPEIWLEMESRLLQNFLIFFDFFLLTEELGISTQNVKKPVISSNKIWIVDSAWAIGEDAG